jgi:two-component system sensor histidine kinase/response regulator
MKGTEQPNLERVRLLYRHAPLGLVATLANALILVFVLWHATPHAALISWLRAVLLVTLIRLALLQRYERSSAASVQARLWTGLFILGIGLSGIVWGCAAIFLFPHGSMAHQVFLAFVLGGLVVGVAGTFSASMTAFFAFMLPAFVPLIVMFFVTGSEIHVAMGVMSLLFALLVSLTAMRLHLASMNQLKLRFENTALIDSLTAERDRAVKVNDELEAEIAHRKQVEETLRLQSGALNSAANAIAITNRRGVVEWVNPAFTRLTGYTLDEVRGQNPRILKSGVHDEAFYRQMWETITSGTVWHGELVNCHKNGSLYTEEMTIAPLANESGDISHFVAIKQDVTERKKAEQRLREVNEFQRQVLSTAATAVFTVDTAQRITSVNAEFCRILGFREQEVVGQHCDILQGEPCLNECGLYDPGRCAPIFRKQCTLQTKAGRVLTVIKNAELTKDEAGQVTGGIESFVDVTDLIEAREQAEAANRAKSEFLANMSHELRTPLNGVIGMTELLLGADLDERHRRFASLAKSSGETLLALINDVLDFSKIEAGKLLLENAEFDLHDSIESVVASFAHRAEQKGLECLCGIDPNVPSAVRGDGGRLQQILLNLTNNAIKFTESGEVAVRVAVESEEDRAARIRFEVVDTGIGIPPDRQDRLFASFSQVDASTTRKYGGTGLGLAICKRLVELMGGQIGVKSEPERGATFWFTITFEKTPKGATSTAERLPASVRGMRVLAVDDNATNREILHEQVSGWGLVCHTASDAFEALAMLREAAAADTPYHLAILDGQLPKMNGLQLAREIKSDSELRSTALILLSSLGHSVEAEEMRSLGFAAWLDKPARSTRLREIIVQVLSGRPAPAEASVGSSTVSREGVSPATHRDVRILLAEDDDIGQEAAIELLTRAGFQCEAVANGRKAVAAATSGSYGLVLMDCQMPEMDGFDATRAIRRHETEHGPLGRNGKPIPIVALTANAVKGDRERCLAAGMDDYVAKPLDIKELVATMDKRLAEAGQHATSEERLQTQPCDPGDCPTVHADVSPFDIDGLQKRWGNDKAFAQKLIGKFCARLSADLEKLEQALADGKVEEATRLAHSLKGAGGYVSAERFRAVAAELEAECRNCRTDGAGRHLERLKTEASRCLSAAPARSARVDPNTSPT